MNLYNKNILLGITGSIAIYRVLDLITALKNEGANVKVILTDCAIEFVAPLTFTSVLGSNKDLVTDKDFFNDTFLHIWLSNWADLFVIVPITANTIAKISTGLADNLLLNVCLAFNKQLAIAPAMNPVMWQNEIVKNNIKVLKERNIKVWGPYEGMVKCGDYGVGRLINIQDLVTYIIKELYPKPLLNKKVIVTAGPTIEPIDQVRFISNNSSGKMGYELSKTAFLLGAEVTLISGPCKLDKPLGCEFIQVKTADEMESATLLEVQQADFLIMSAAVSDFKVSNIANKKISKLEIIEQIKFDINNDILSKVTTTLEKKPFCVGFALENGDIIDRARNKLFTKNADVIIGNIIGQNTGFESDTNEVYIITKDTDKKINLMPKTELSVAIWAEILDIYVKLA